MAQNAEVVKGSATDLANKINTLISDGNKIISVVKSDENSAFVVVSEEVTP